MCHSRYADLGRAACRRDAHYVVGLSCIAGMGLRCVADMRLNCVAVTLQRWCRRILRRLPRRAVSRCAVVVVKTDPGSIESPENLSMGSQQAEHDNR